MTRLSRCLLVGVLGIALAATGCEHADPLDPNQLQPTLSSIQTNIFSVSCALSGCHVGGSDNLPGSMNLRSGQVRANTVDVRSAEMPSLFRIAPGDPDNSYLVWKIEGDPRIAGMRMPIGRPPLSAEQIDVIREWIANGALDD